MTVVRPPDPDKPDEEPRRRFDEFYVQTATRTFQAACGVARGDIEVARDATQEAYLTMPRLWASGGRSVQDPARHVVGIAVKKVVDHYRRQARHEVLADGDVLYAEISAALDGMSQSTARTHVQRLRRKLTPFVERITQNGGEGGERR